MTEIKPNNPTWGDAELDETVRDLRSVEEDEGAYGAAMCVLAADIIEHLRTRLANEEQKMWAEDVRAFMAGLLASPRYSASTGAGDCRAMAIDQADVMAAERRKRMEARDD